ncbi:hypothetical protein K490DRAFT_54710 [Saccharata proteae CBS 121410]|uniref:Uncharacterized protein n=1 Tax=Saccharata proteae CBS 121410 TaxID=1314787 RepID=A0A9P4I156_9PEZI|nr:hypothetical protein K490DRAFT_54710 [Saccharata proteae CBS 121410]
MARVRGFVLPYLWKIVLSTIMAVIIKGKAFKEPIRYRSQIPVTPTALLQSQNPRPQESHVVAVELAVLDSAVEVCLVEDCVVVEIFKNVLVDIALVLSVDVDDEAEAISVEKVLDAIVLAPVDARLDEVDIVPTDSEALEDGEESNVSALDMAVCASTEGAMVGLLVRNAESNTERAFGVFRSGFVAVVVMADMSVAVEINTRELPSERAATGSDAYGLVEVSSCKLELVVGDGGLGTRERGGTTPPILDLEDEHTRLLAAFNEST